MKKIIYLLFLVVPLFFYKDVFASDTLLFDSTNNYLGACQLTDRSEWTLDKDLDITLFQVWYNWDADETELPVTVLYQGEEFANFTAKRTNCDTYQKQWCNADYQINKLFPKGKYETKIPSKKQCLKPGGTGAIRLFGAETVAQDTPSTPTPPPITTTPTVAPVVTTNEPQSCSCTKTILITAVGASLVSSLVFSLLLRKK